MHPAAVYAFLCTLPFVCAAVPTDWEGAFARLSAPAAAERDAAQREFAAGLELRAAPRLAQLLRAADEEQRARTAAALAERARLLGLALELAGDPDRRVARVGAEAVETHCLLSVAKVRDTTEAEEYEWLLERAGAEVRLDGPLAAASTPDLLDVLVRAGRPALRAALDPDAIDAREPLPRAEGDFVLWLSACASVRGLRHDIYTDEDGAGLVVLGAAPPEAQRPAGLASLRRRWLQLASDSAPDARERRGRAARALADSGWPAALEWLAQRAAGGDDVALEALCAQAEDGRGARELAGADAGRARARLEALRASALDAGDAARATLCTRGLAALSLLDPARRWPVPAADKRLLPYQLLELRLAPLDLAAAAGTEREPALLGEAWSAPEADADRLLAAWRVAYAHGLRVPKSVRELHGVRLAARLSQAGCIDAALELAGGAGLLPEQADSGTLDWRFELALCLAQGSRARAAQLLAPQVAQDAGAAAFALRAVRARLDAAGAARAQALALDASWIADQAPRKAWELLHAQRELTSAELAAFPDLEATLAVVGGRPEQTTARRTLVGLCADPSRSSRRIADAAATVLEQLEAAGRHDLAAELLAALRAGAKVRAHAAALQPGRFPPPAVVAVPAVWHDLQPGRSLP